MKIAQLRKLVNTSKLLGEFLLEIEEGKPVFNEVRTIKAKLDDLIDREFEKAFNE